MIKNALAILGAIALAKYMLEVYDKHVKKPLERAVGDALDG